MSEWETLPWWQQRLYVEGLDDMAGGDDDDGQQPDVPLTASDVFGP